MPAELALCRLCQGDIARHKPAKHWVLPRTFLMLAALFLGLPQQALEAIIPIAVRTTRCEGRFARESVISGVNRAEHPWTSPCVYGIRSTRTPGDERNSKGGGQLESSCTSSQRGGTA